MRIVITGYLIIVITCFCSCGHENRKTEDPIPGRIADTSQNTLNPAVKPDTSNKEIYDFMKVVITEQLLDLNHGLRLETESSIDFSGDDRKFLNTLLIESEKKKTADTSNLENITVRMGQLQRCLTRSDINLMLTQQMQTNDMKWDNSRLHFDLNNHKNYYAFSVPLFSADRKKAVMKIEDLCPGLCGYGWEVLFIRQNDTWVSEKGQGWWH